MYVIWWIFKNNQKEGEGKDYYEKEVLKYGGKYKNNKREGEGVYYYSNGEYLKCNFKNGLAEGKGIEYYKNDKRR